MYDKEPQPTAGRAWLTLFRPPNLFTAPGDPLVGALLACSALGIMPHWPAIGATMGAALLFYAAGLLSNDYFDRAVDARERPDRPLPSGSVNPATVLIVALILTLGGLLLLIPAGWRAVVAGLIVATGVWFYNSIGKNIPRLAPFSMGICRGFSMLMGASVEGYRGASAQSVTITFFGLILFIALVTHIARHEAEAQRPTIPAWARLGLPVLLSIWMGLSLHRTILSFDLSAILAAMSVLWAVVWAIQLKPRATPRQVQSAVGGLIRGLILTQAAWCASAGPQDQGAALLLLVAFPVSGWLGKWFYGS